jgi:hypothetical protein
MIEYCAYCHQIIGKERYVSFKLPGGHEYVFLHARKETDCWQLWTKQFLCDNRTALENLTPKK